ncbi:zinc ABC transporter substrate-binding protein [Vibrio clamense]|uniref:zinc ABC transporter substrate-binding protein n=1 Tax=Vibrio clamense TaxID=2910254 RepID=UPI003D1F055A
MFRFTYLVLVALCLPSAAWASTILTSIKPIQMITHELTKGVVEPDVILSSNASPHDYALKPSDVKKINNAGLIVWFGPELEPFLSKVISSQKNVLTISEIKGLPLREFGGGHESHAGHDHGSHDPHFWLGLKPSLQVAEAITARLIQSDSKNQSLYQKNLNDFSQRLLATEADVSAILAPVKTEGYYVFHDAYGYFEQEFELNNLGHFTVSPDRKPGAKTLIKIRKALRKNDIQCVFSEPQFTPAVIESVTRGTNVTIGILDPVGSQIEAKDGAYFEFIKGMANSYSSCLQR